VPDRRSRPRVILVEDDAALRRFVEMALETLDLELVACDAVAPALAALAAGGADLVLTDLMLQGESGLELVERLAADPARAPKVAIFSANVPAAVRARLESLGVWRILPKPIGLAELERCVLEAVAATPDAGQATAAPAPDGQAQAVAEYFGGDAALYGAFRATCLAQFPRDAAAADAACRAGDLPALRRVAHNLKTVLESLGEPELSAGARALEDAAELGDAAVAARCWEAMRPLFLRLSSHS